MPVLLARAKLLAPIAVTDVVHLDALLMAVEPTIASSHITRTCAIEPYTLRGVARVSARGHDIHTASAMLVDDRVGIGRDTMTKRRDPTDVYWHAGKIDTRAGPTRDYALPIPTIETDVAEWLVIGRRRSILERLPAVRSVGGRRKIGYGVVAEWTLEVVEVDPVEVFVADGRARRHLPAEWCLEAAHTDRGAIAPPYWHSGSVTERVRAGTPCVLAPQVEAKVRKCY